jgi:UPF0755 protein
MPARRRAHPLQPPADERPTEIIHLEPEPELEPGFEDGLEDVVDDEYADDYDDEYEEDEDFYDEDEELDDEEHAEPEYIEDERPPRKRKRGKRAFGWVAALVVLAVLVGGAWYGVNTIFGYDDFQGSGASDVLVQVADGDSTGAIATKLTSAGVVASNKAFTSAGADNSAVGKIQPGYYVLKKNMSGASAVERITAASSRVGELQIKAYTQFDDVTQPDNKVTPGIYSLLAKASCADLNGKSTCIPVEELRKTVETADLASLGVPSWAVGEANKTPDKFRRLEGLVAPGVYDVMPGWSATELLTHVVKTSAAELQVAGLNDAASVEGKNPYQILTIASIIEREAVKADFAKISRVIYNRLAAPMKLEMDSTVNYALERPVLLTDKTDRNKGGAYNTYQSIGLPPTPISAPSPEAIQAALKPVDGDILFFVKCETNGLSCFAATNTEHNKNRADAQARGVY